MGELMKDQPPHNNTKAKSRFLNSKEKNGANEKN